MTTTGTTSANARKAELLADADAISTLFNRTRDRLLALAAVESEIEAARVALASVREETGRLRAESARLAGPLKSLAEAQAALMLTPTL